MAGDLLVESNFYLLISSTWLHKYFHLFIYSSLLQKLIFKWLGWRMFWGLSHKLRMNLGIPVFVYLKCYKYSFIIFLFKKIIFNWRIIVLQYCVGSWDTSTWISHRYAYVPSFLTLLPTPFTPSRLSQSSGLSSLCYTQLPMSYLFYIW